MTQPTQDAPTLAAEVERLREMLARVSGCLEEAVKNGIPLHEYATTRHDARAALSRYQGGVSRGR